MQLQHPFAARSRLSGNPPRRKSSKCFEGMPAFGLPVLSLIFLVEWFLFQICWIKPSISVKGVRTKCLRRFIIRCRASHVSKSLHALRSMSLYFLRIARFLKILVFENEALQTAEAVLLIALKPYSGAPPCSSVSNNQSRLSEPPASGRTGFTNEAQWNSDSKLPPDAMISASLFFGEFTLGPIGHVCICSAGNGTKTSFPASPDNQAS